LYDIAHRFAVYHFGYKYGVLLYLPNSIPFELPGDLEYALLQALAGIFHIEPDRQRQFYRGFFNTTSLPLSKIHKRNKYRSYRLSQYDCVFESDQIDRRFVVLKIMPYS